MTIVSSAGIMKIIKSIMSLEKSCIGNHLDQAIKRKIRRTMKKEKERPKEINQRRKNQSLKRKRSKWLTDKKSSKRKRRRKLKSNL